MNIKYIYTSELKETIRNVISACFLFTFSFIIYYAFNLKMYSNTFLNIENSNLVEQIFLIFF
jgi:hypothetical protein